MNNKEKILLLQLLLEDIRGNWGWDNGKKPRHEVALELAKDLEMNEHIERIKTYIKDYNVGFQDGRTFRCSYEMGGYIGMEELHGLDSKTADYKSKEFVDLAFKYLTYPEL